MNKFLLNISLAILIAVFFGTDVYAKVSDVEKDPEHTEEHGDSHGSEIKPAHPSDRF